MGFVVDEVSLLQGTIRVLRSSAISSIPPMIHVHSFICHRRRMISAKRERHQMNYKVRREAVHSCYFASRLSSHAALHTPHPLPNIYPEKINLHKTVSFCIL